MFPEFVGFMGKFVGILGRFVGFMGKFVGILRGSLVLGQIVGILGSSLDLQPWAIKCTPEAGQFES